MKLLSERTSLLVGAALSLAALTVFANTSPRFDIHTHVISKAAKSENGVILVLSNRGPVAAEAAYLLLAQTQQNQGYAPLLMAIEDQKITGYMAALALPDASLPAVIFFNKAGTEMARVVSVNTATTKVSLLQGQKPQVLVN